MAKKGQISHYAAQKAAKPDVRELIELTCDGEVRTRALELLAFFQSLRMKPAWASTNSYALSYKGKRVGYFKLGRGDKFARNCLDVQIYPIENYDAFLRGRTEDERALFCAEFGNSFVRPCRACEDYWRERMKWSNDAGWLYWKVDWGNDMHKYAVRRLMTELRRAYILETAVGTRQNLPPEK